MGLEAAILLRKRKSSMYQGVVLIKCPRYFGQEFKAKMGQTEFSTALLGSGASTIFVKREC